MERVKRTFARMLADRDYDILVATPSFPNGNKNFDASFVLPGIASEAATAAHAHDALRVLDETRNIEETERRVGTADTNLALIYLLYMQKGLVYMRDSIGFGNTNFFPWFEVANLARGVTHGVQNVQNKLKHVSNVLNNPYIRATVNEHTFRHCYSCVLLPHVTSPEGYYLMIIRDSIAKEVLARFSGNKIPVFEVDGTVSNGYRYLWIDMQSIPKLRIESDFSKSLTDFVLKYISSSSDVPYEDVVETIVNRLTLKNVDDFARAIIYTNASDSWAQQTSIKVHFGHVQKKLAAILTELNTESRRNVGIALVQGILDEVDYNTKEGLRQVRSEPFYYMVRELLNEMPWLRSDSRLSSFLRTGNDLAGSDIHAR